MQDLQYRDFHSALMPTVDRETVIGVRIPALRQFAKSLYGTAEAEDFMRQLPHRYYEENNLHAFLIEPIRDFDVCVAALDAFLPYVNNWATCDSMTPKIFKKHLDELDSKIPQWLASDHAYTVRYGIEMRMKFFLDDRFEPRFAEEVANIHHEDYYVRMMQAWYFATALAKQYDAVIPYLEQHRLDPWIHQKTVRKAIESYRISEEQKGYLRGV